MTQKKKVGLMRNTEKIMKQNSLTSEIIIKFGLGVAVLVLCVVLIYKVGIPVAGIIGGYILVRSVLKIIKLSIQIFFSVLTILFLIAVISLTVVSIF
jgi:hypothetical protein